MESLRNPYPATWPIIRRRILERDGRRCQHCAATDDLTVSHINRHEPDCRPANLWTLCRRCHLAYDRADNARRRRYGKRAHLVQVPIWSAPSPGAGNADGQGLAGEPPRLPVE